MLELATLVRKYRGALIERRGYLPENQFKALNAIESCRNDFSKSINCHCPNCKHEHWRLASCKNRHCPKCQHKDADRWLTTQCERLIPVTHFMATFTAPCQLRNMMFYNQSEAYTAFFEAVKATLDEVGSDPRCLGGKYGYTAILHTWNRRLDYHPHIHCIIPGGAFDQEKNIWRKSSNEYFFNVKNLSKIFKGKLFIALKKRGLTKNLPRGSFKQELVVHVKPVGKGKEALKYIAPYIFRVAISNRRIIALKNDMVTFEYKNSKTKLIEQRTLHAVDFLELYLKHVLPDNFMKVRNYGLCHHSNRLILDKLAVLLNWKQPHLHLKSTPIQKCPECGSELMTTFLFAITQRQLARVEKSIIKQEAPP
tara:strand:+ start:260 stop:1360 length:1101 start_codon:yes stop_codon:yes gene_type:complete